MMVRFSFPVATYRRMTMFESPAHVGSLQGSVDFVVPSGTPVLAAAGGIVIDQKGDSVEGGTDQTFENYGNFIEIKHDDGTYSEYEHLSRVDTRPGQFVRRGAPIGLSGATGWLAHLGPHLHFMVGRYEGSEFVASEIQWIAPEEKADTPISLAWANVERVEDLYWPNNRSRSLEGLLTAIVSEVGEVADQIKRIDGYGSSGREFSEEGLVEELADVQSYLITFLMRLGVTQEQFAQVMNAKMTKVEERMMTRSARLNP